MGNQIEKEFNIKEKPLKLPGSYNFLRFTHHPSEDLSLIIVKAPHRATPISSTLILPIKEIRPLGSDSVAVCQKCLPLALVKPRSETQMKILMHKILKSSTEIGRCFFYSGRVMLWCEEKRGIASSSPEQVDTGKPHEKSKVFVSGIALINFLYCVYEQEAIRTSAKPKSKSTNNSSKSSLKDKVNEKLKEKEKPSANEGLPQEIKLFFQPKDKKEYYEALYSMESRLNQSAFWSSISQGLRELLLNMISQDPEKRIDLQSILTIPYFMDSNQLRLYSTLADDLEEMAPREAKIFMSSLQLIIREGLTIQQSLMQDYFRPVLCSMVMYNAQEGKENDHLLGLALSVLIQLDHPPIDAIYHGFRKAHAKNHPITRLALSKKQRLLAVLPSEYFDSVLSRAIFASFESESLIEAAVLSVPFAIRNIKQPNYRKEVEFLLINRVLLFPVGQMKDGLLVDGLKCMIFLVREGLISGCSKLESLVYNPLKLTIQANFHVLYLYGLMIQSISPLELLDKMMPKLQLFLNDPEVYDELFVVAKRCVDRILERLYEQRKIDPQEMTGLQKEEGYFDMREDKPVLSPEDTKLILKKEIEKHEIQRLKWTIPLL